ncbi:hypothetical protein MWN52_13580 [Pseudoxanthomonas winnipegensis]|uniref:hypothetical protein n=1 Tax=Pseudoxanthomonas winnipegensis TaxID=2480810 RepID=UPI002574A243|nr:hypothetical protein [Pseudoxanthomonas winnipegensis]WJI14651.1 hypothetical protein MWN52_13580 [Pseudoxanthomonas winnipegensis]
MRIPNRTETDQYFSTLGYRFIEGTDDKGSFLEFDDQGQGLPFHGRRYRSLGELWLAWLGYASLLIFEWERFRLFMKSYDKAGPMHREELVEALRCRIWHKPAPLLDHLFADVTPPGADHLPRTWKAKLARLWANEDRSMRFNYLAARALENKGWVLT